MRCYCFYGTCWPGALPLYALLLASPGRVLTQPCWVGGVLQYTPPTHLPPPCPATLSLMG